MLLVDISQFIPLKCKPCHEEYIARTRGDYQAVVPSETGILDNMTLKPKG